MTAQEKLFHHAIAAGAFIRSNAITPIIRSEHTGDRDEWIFDFRAIMLQPTWLACYAELFWERFATQYPFQVGGLETASIALITAIVMKGIERGTPVNGFYVRKSRKRQGLMKQVEGTLTDDPIVLVDDLINSGQSFLRQLEILESLGKTVRDVFVILAFRDDATYHFLNDRGVRFSKLFTVADFDIPLLKETPDVPDDAFVEHWLYAPQHMSHYNVVQKSAPILFENLILYGGDDGIFRALDSEHGTVVWNFKVGRHPDGKGILSSPCIYNGTVFFGAYDGNVYALNARSGTQQWQYDHADWIGSSPAVAGKFGVICIGLEFGLFRKRGGIAAIDIATGVERWNAPHAALTHGSPLYIESEDIVVIGDNDGVVYAYRASDGELLWRTPCDSDIKTTPAYDAKRKQILCGTIKGTLYALSVHNGSPMRAFSTAGFYSIPLVIDDVAYVASLDKHLYALDLVSWKPRWEFRTNGRIFASPRLFDDSVWIGSNDGRLYEIDPKTGTLIRFFQTTERILNAVEYDASSKKIYIPTSSNGMYCISKKMGADA